MVKGYSYTVPGNPLKTERRESANAPPLTLYSVPSTSTLEDPEPFMGPSTGYSFGSFDGAGGRQRARQYSGAHASNLFFQQPTVRTSDWKLNTDYAFGYSNIDGTARQERAEQGGIVRGSYTTMGADGNPMEVHYISGPGIGFRIENLDEVRAKSVPNVANPYVSNGPVSSAYTVSAAHGGNTYTQVSSMADVMATAADVHNLAVPSSNAHLLGPVAAPVDQVGLDQGYTFQFATADGASRQEQADGVGNVRGHYTYLNQEGNPIVVHYSAGAGNGFVVENQSELNALVHQATRDANVANSVSNRNFGNLGHLDTANMFIQSSSGVVGGRRVVRKRGRRRHGLRSRGRQDAAYQLNLETPEQRHEERVDANGERIGSYSYVDPNGKNVVVKYRAGINGFEILNPEQVLPQPIV